MTTYRQDRAFIMRDREMVVSSLSGVLNEGACEHICVEIAAVGGECGDVAGKKTYASLLPCVHSNKCFQETLLGCVLL